METEQTAKEIFDYMAGRLAEGVDISKEDEAEMVKEIGFLIDTN